MGAGTSDVGAIDTDSAGGLGPEEIGSRIAAGLVNSAPTETGRTLGQILRANVLTRFNAILGGLLVVVAIVGPPQDALFGAVLVANTSIGVLQEVRAKRQLERLAVLSAPHARVVRSGRLSEIPVDEVVLDDVLELHPGDQVVVDAVVLQCQGLELDESLLTGESRPVAKAPLDPVLSGSFVAAGTGRVRTSAVGDASYATQLESDARRFSLIRSELQQGTNEILRLVTWVMVPAGIGLVLSQLLRSNQSLADSLRASVAGVSAMVPEGLVLLTSIAFAAGALRLARRQVLVQELAAIEGLARVNVLCIDKTGTLTSPEMEVQDLRVIDGRAREAEAALGALAAADPAPNATIRALAERFPAPPDWSVSDRVPFSSERKWSAASFGNHGTWILGAPDMIVRSLPDPLRSGISAAQAAGRRVLLLAASAAIVAAPALPASLEPVALLVLSESLRPDAAATVSYLVDQGITVKVLSGDAPDTVAAVAGQVGIAVGDAPCDASELVSGGASMDVALDSTNVFGRVRPEQKLEAVRSLQSNGHVVAMVGDGVNDVQALKQADLGIAMGSGSQSSRSVARVVLLDSSFAAMPQVLAEGRRVIANIERVANLFVTKTAYAAILAVAVAITAVQYPFFPRHLTVVSTVTIGVPGFFLAFAAGAPRAAPGFTRRVLWFAIPAGIAAAAATFASYAIVRAWPGATIVQARTTAMLALIAVGLWVLVLIARPLRPLRVALLVCMAGAVALLFVSHFSRSVVGIEFPPPGAAVVTACVVVGAIALLTLWRAAVRRHERRAR